MQKKNGYKSKGKPGRRPYHNDNGRKNKEPDAVRDKTVLNDGAYDSNRNDWRWYATSPQLVKDSASYPYSYALGSRLYLGTYGANMNSRSLPGVCSIHFVPTIGYSDNANSPINVWSREIYSDIRHTNSGSANYDPTDMMIYLIGMDSCYMMLEFMKRAYGVMRLVSPVNRYMPEALIRSMGLNYSDFSANLDDFRAFINTYAQKLKALVIPNGMSYMAKHQWLVSGIYQDHPTDKSQFYLFVPNAYMAFTYDSDGAGMLRSLGWDITNPKTFAQVKSFANSLLDPLLAEQDFSIISGDILKWRGEGGVVTPTGITETYQVFPTYDASVLDQIQNASILGTVHHSDDTVSALGVDDASKALEIRQGGTNKEYLVSTPWFRHPYHWGSNWANPGRNVYMVKRLVNFDHDAVTPEQTMEATRLTNIASAVALNTSTGYDWFKFTTLGSEAVVSVVFWYYGDKTTGGVTQWTLNMVNVPSMSLVNMQSINSGAINQSTLSGLVATTEETMLSLNLISCFARHPYFAITTGVYDTKTNTTLTPAYGSFAGYFGDANYYAIVDVQDLEQMSEVALMSEFNVRMGN